MNYLEQFKFVICSLISGMLSLFFPMRDFMFSMLIVFGVNYVFGLIAGLKHGEKWDFKKSMVFFYHCTLFFVMTSAIFITGYFLHAGDETLGVIKALCGVAIWFYSTNIVRNWKIMLIPNTPMWRVAGFVYYVLTLKAVDKIPFLKDYLKTGNFTDDEKV